MKHYIDESGNVYGYPKAGTREMTAEEFETFKNPPPTPEQIANQEQAWVVSELNNADILLSLAQEGSKRAVHTAEEVIVYKEALRDYVQNVEGVLTVVGERPVLGGEA